MNEFLPLVIALCVTILLSYPIRFIRNKTQRYLYSFIIGSVIQALIYRWQIIILYIQNLIVYLIIKVKGRKCGALVTVQSMLYVSLYHIYSMYVDYGGYHFNISGLLMITVCKYSLFAYAYQDGGLIEQKLTEQAKYDAIKDLPSYIDFLGYLNFLPSCLIGPAMDYSNYKNFMEQREPYTKIPSPWKQVGITLVEAIACGAVFGLGQMLCPADYMKTTQFSQKGVAYILLFPWISLTGLRFKYHFVWKLSTCSIQSCGIGYSAKNCTFNKMNSSNVIPCQTSIHFKDKISNWNISGQEWLRKTIYQRSPFKSKGASQLLVFMVSAFWHGYYPGYYLFFFFLFLQVYVQGLIFKFTKPKNSILKSYFDKSGRIGRFLVTIFVHIVSCAGGISFSVLQGRKSLNLMAKVYFIPHLILVAGLVIFSLPIGKRKIRKTQIRQEQELKLTPQ